MEERQIVYSVKVVCRNLFLDLWAGLKNLIGGNIKTYEKMIDKGCAEALMDLYTKYPNVKFVRFQLSIMAPGTIAVLAYGEVPINKTSS